MPGHYTLIALLSRSLYSCNRIVIFEFLLCQNESSRETMKMCFPYKFIFTLINQLIFNMKDFTWGPVLKQRHEVSQKWPQDLIDYPVANLGLTCPYLFSVSIGSRTSCNICKKKAKFNFKWKYERLAVVVHILELNCAE